MVIERIYINTHRYDRVLTETCVASVRYWYPDIPVSLIFDYSNGSYNYQDLCRRWDVGVLDTQGRKYGWGFGKFEPLFLGDTGHFLVLDADTVLSGPVLNKFSSMDADFVVDHEQPSPEQIKTLYYDLERVREIYPDFDYPGYTFNTGQWVGRGGVIKPADFEKLVIWQPSPRLRYPEIFKQADQGIFNLLIHLMEKENKIKVEKIPLMIWPVSGIEKTIRLSPIKEKSPEQPFIIHWAGMKFKKLESYNLGDILVFYRLYFYSRFNSFYRFMDGAMIRYLHLEKKVRNRAKKLKRSRSL